MTCTQVGTVMGSAGRVGLDPRRLPAGTGDGADAGPGTARRAARGEGAHPGAPDAATPPPGGAGTAGPGGEAPTVNRHAETTAIARRNMDSPDRSLALVVRRPPAAPRP
ncbi:hypothetical protein GCM10022252_37780 [Streptosporangium oxazolinicum]|uniref:Uncharacterized protein n=1 Tax=Streptosporangium oxazolinicum TaxID=909287 RepID=A0ABP8AZ14_9ACTN